MNFLYILNTLFSLLMLNFDNKYEINCGQNRGLSISQFFFGKNGEPGPDLSYKRYILFKT
jgi:hypothetical protein